MPEACTCGVAPGTRRCDATGQLGSCDCAALPVPSFDAAVVSEGSCPTGLYEGNFEGEAGFLIATGQVSGFDLFDDKPPLQIMLEAQAGSGEFTVVGDGTMRGSADGAFPFEATIHGTLDCNTKQFKARLVGWVQLVLDGVNNDFTGTMTATYDREKHAFVGGMWTVTGSEADGGSDFGLTGDGTWMAGLAPEDAGMGGGADAGP